MLRLLKYLKWYHIMFVIIIISLVYVQVTADLMLPEYFGNINQRIYDQMFLGTVFLERELINLGIEMLLITLLSFGSTIIVGYISGITGAQFATILREKIFKKVQSFSLEEMDKFSTASLITRSTNDIRQVSMVLTLILRIAIASPLMAIKGIMKATNLAQSMTFIIIIAVLFLVILIATIFLIVLPKFNKMQKLTDRLNQVTRENLTGLRVIRAFSAEKQVEEKFEDTSKRVQNNNIFVNRNVSLIMPSMMFIMNATSLMIIWVGAIFIDRGSIGSIGDVIEFQQYSMQIVMSFLMLIMIFIMAPRGIISGIRINEVLKTKQNIVDIENPVTSFNQQGKIEFINVSFKYPDAKEAVLSDINFEILKGETVAFIGSTGSGKSTLINLLPRFYNPTSGTILVNGINILDISAQTLRSLIGYVPQKGVLFSGDITYNMQYGKNDATIKEIDEALKISQAYDFVLNLENKYAHNISQGGINISGGQRQRICIARALIKKPEIFIFDDSFSALDFKTDKSLRKELNAKTKGVTKIIVAQRIGTIMDADKIIVLEEGKIVGMGRHEELLKKCSVYHEIASSQLGLEADSHV